jgi:hypothetical protein
MNTITKQVFILAFFLFVISNTPLKSQNQNWKCSLTYTELNTEFCLLELVENFDFLNGTQIVQDILNKSGINNFNFLVKPCQSIDNAIAIYYNNKRYILFDPNFIANISSNDGSSFTPLLVLAHEIGHHIFGHTLSITNDLSQQRKNELEADYFAGYVLAKFGGEEAHIIQLFNNISNTVDDSNSSHPNRSKRIAKALEGYNDGMATMDKIILELIKQVPYNPTSLEYLTSKAHMNLSKWLNSDSELYLQNAEQFYKRIIQNFDNNDAIQELSLLYYYSSRINDCIKLKNHLYKKTQNMRFKLELESYKIVYEKVIKGSCYTPIIDDSILNTSTFDYKELNTVYHLFKVLNNYNENNEDSIVYQKIMEHIKSFKNVVNDILISSYDDSVNFSSIMNSIGLIYLKTSESSKAVDYFNKSLEFIKTIKPRYSIRTEMEMLEFNKIGVSINLALSLVQDSQHNESYKIINDEIFYLNKVNKDNYKKLLKLSYYVRGRCNLESGMDEKSLIDFNLAIDKDACKKENAVFYYYRGVAYSSIDNNNDACIDFKTSCENGCKQACQNFKFICE